MVDIILAATIIFNAVACQHLIGHLPFCDDATQMQTGGMARMAHEQHRGWPQSLHFIASHFAVVGHVQVFCHQRQLEEGHRVPSPLECKKKTQSVHRRPRDNKRPRQHRDLGKTNDLGNSSHLAIACSKRAEVYSNVPPLGLPLFPV